MTARPTGDHIFVRPIAPTERIGSIYLPPKRSDDPTGRGVPCLGTVVAVGPGAWARKRDKQTGEHVFLVPDVRVGETVLFSRFAGADHVIDGEQLKVLAECDVLAVIEQGTVTEFNELAA